MSLSIPLVFALVATAVVGVWRVTADGAAEAVRIAALSVASLLVGALLQLIAWGGILVGVAAAIAFATLESHELLEQRRWLIEQAKTAASPTAARLLIQDRADQLKATHSFARAAVTLGALGFLTVVSIFSMLRGLEPNFRSRLFLGCVGLFLPIAHVVAVNLRRIERRRLEHWLSHPPSPREGKMRGEP